MTEPVTAVAPAAALPYAVPAPESPRILRRLGLVVTPLAAVRVLALLVFVGGPIVVRDGPQRPRHVPRPPGGILALVGTAAQAAGAGLLLAGGVVCLRRRPAGRVVVAWGAALLLAAAAYAAAMELHFLWKHGQGAPWAAYTLDVIDRNAWDAAFPALLLLVSRR